MARSISALSSWRQHTFAALNDRHFRLLFVGTLFATFAYMMMFLVMSIVAYDLSGNNTAVGVIGMGVGIAMLLAPFGGVIADRANRKWVIVIGQGGGAAMLALTGLLLLLGWLTLPLMFVLMMLLGFSFVVMGPARNAFTADLVGPRLVANAIVLSQLANTLGQPLSPFIASILVESLVGSGGTYVVMGALVAVGVFTVA
ncbi:MAG: MFS transporter, partial [Chloroflexi bacterium]|nr:MFS transporter [Chloroflexota bacterium]